MLPNDATTLANNLGDLGTKYCDTTNRINGKNSDTYIGRAPPVSRLAAMRTYCAMAWVHLMRNKNTGMGHRICGHLGSSPNRLVTTVKRKSIVDSRNRTMPGSGWTSLKNLQPNNGTMAARTGGSTSVSKIRCWSTGPTNNMQRHMQPSTEFSISSLPP